MTTMSLVSSLVYALLTWYIDNINPGQSKRFNTIQIKKFRKQYKVHFCDRRISFFGFFFNYHVGVCVQKLTSSILPFLHLISQVTMVYQSPGTFHHKDILVWASFGQVRDSKSCYSRLPGWLQKVLVSLGCINARTLVEDMVDKVNKENEGMC